MALPKDTENLEEGLSIVVAVYNGAVTVEELVQRVDAAFSARPEAWEIILVNDGSRDESWAKIVGLAQREGRVRGIDLARNVGQHNALLCGIRQARYRVTATLDDDLQHAPNDIPRLLQALSGDVDVVYGLSTHQRRRRWRLMASWLLGRTLQRWGNGGASRYSAFRVFRTRLRDAFADRNIPCVCIDVLLSWGTSRFAMVNVVDTTAVGQPTRYTVQKLVSLAIDAIHGFGVAPVGMAVGLGLAGAVLGIAQVLFGLLVPGGASTKGLIDPVAVVVLFAGLQICMMGWLGTYLIRILETAIGRPSYIISQTTDDVRAAAD